MKLNNRALVMATTIGTVLQLIMVMVGHSNPDVKNLFAAGGMGISFIAGILYTVISHRSDHSRQHRGWLDCGRCVRVHRDCRVMSVARRAGSNPGDGQRQVLR